MPAPHASPVAVKAFSGIEGLSLSAVTAVLFGMTFLFFLPFIFSGDMIYGSDTLNGIYTRIYYADFFKQYHTFPRLLSVTLSGMPTLDAFMGDMLYPPAALQFILSVPKALGYKYLISVFVSGVFMFLFLFRGLSLRKDVSLLGALCFMFNTEFVSHLYPGHDGKMFVISLLPLSLYGLKRLLDTRQLRFAVVLSVSIGLCLLTSHVQTTYFSLWGIGFYFLFETVRAYQKERSKRRAFGRTALFTTAVILGMCLGMVQFLPPYQFTKQYSVRGEGEKTSYEHAASWSIHAEEAFSLIVPEFGGFQDKEESATGGVHYWGRNPFKLNNEYAGILVLVCAVFFLLIYRKDRFIVFWAAIAGGALVFALGGDTPLFYLFYYFVPGVKLFRAPSMIMFWFSMALVVLTAYGLNELLGGKALSVQQKERYAKRILMTLAVLGGLTLFVTAARDAVQGLWKGIFYGGLAGQKLQAFEANYPAFVKGAWCALALGGAALFAFYLFLKDSLRKEALIIVLCLIAIADLFRVDAYFYKLVNPSEVLNENDPLLIDLARQSKQDHFRVFPAMGFGNNDVQLYGLQSVLGFHDNELKVYREFSGGQNRANFVYNLSNEMIQTGAVYGNPFLDLLSVRYLLFKPSQSQPAVAIPNRTVLPRAFCASDFEIVREGDAVRRLREPGFPYRTKILLEEVLPASIMSDTAQSPAGAVQSFRIEKEDRVITAQMQKNGFLVLSDIYIPYWNAYENGKKLKVYKTDAALMSVYLAPGTHTVTFKYESPYIALGAKITFLGLAICILLLLSDRVILRREKAQGSAVSPEAPVPGKIL
jgi:hypothetical protein